MTSLAEDAKKLINALSGKGRMLVAFSGGVDSSVVLAAACRAELDEVTALTAQSPSVPQWQLDEARRVAAELGVDHQVVQTRELELEDYRKNDRQRCFYCKDTLYRTLHHWADRSPNVRLVSGTNADDLGDYRPGIEAGRRRGVLTPLADLGIGKPKVRQLAAYFQLSNRDLPASPCLASRVAYGVAVNPERLRRIERAEAYLRGMGFQQVRVRLLTDEAASIEVERASVAALRELDRDGGVAETIRDFGFRNVSIDERGFRSGRLNDALITPPLVQLSVHPLEDSAGGATQHPDEASS